MKVYHKSKKTGGRDDWGTPKALIKALEKGYCSKKYPKFTIDLAASKKNAVCKRYIDKKTDFFKYDFSKEKGIAFLNPPYSEALLFVERAYEIARVDFKVIVLVASRTDSGMFHNFAWSANTAYVNFIRGRIKFTGAKDSAPFPSLIFTFGGPRVFAFCNTMPLAFTPEERGF